jgi:hypothetical protein
MNNRPQVLISDAFVNILRVAEKDPSTIKEWIDEMEDRIVILHRFDDILLGVFADDSVVCAPNSKYNEQWYSGDQDHFISYLTAFPRVADVLVPVLVGIFDAAHKFEEAKQ